MTVKELRRKTGLSQHKFADVVGVPLSSIQHWEQGYRTPPRYVLELMEKVLRYEGQLKYTAQDFELFKSNTCHRLKNRGDIQFLSELLQSTEIEDRWALGRKEEALYLLAMSDYLSQKIGVSLCSKYDTYRVYKLNPVIYPLSVRVMGVEDNLPFTPIKEFLNYGIIEGDVYDVC